MSCDSHADCIHLFVQPNKKQPGPGADVPPPIRIETTSPACGNRRENVMQCKPPHPSILRMQIVHAYCLCRSASISLGLTPILCFLHSPCPGIRHDPAAARMSSSSPFAALPITTLLLTSSSDRQRCMASPFARSSPSLPGGLLSCTGYVLRCT
jgi:hypothetical protein